jgi:Nucleotidyltransferase domain
MTSEDLEPAVSGPAIPSPIAEFVEVLAALPGARAVALGGSRVAGNADEQSDWDFAVYYRSPLDTSALEAWGAVHPPGSWGRIMNGGAWLSVGGRKVDVLLRDLDAVEHWSAQAEAGLYDVDFLLSYLAGCPTYSLLAERALGRVLRGELPAVGGFPPKLRETAPGRWRFHRDFSLEHARMRAARGDLVGTLGQAARASIEEAHARLCEEGVWVLNEKRIVAQAGLAPLEPLFADAPRDVEELVAWVARVGEALRGPTPSIQGCRGGLLE